MNKNFYNIFSPQRGWVPFGMPDPSGFSVRQTQLKWPIQTLDFGTFTLTKSGQCFMGYRLPKIAIRELGSSGTNHFAFSFL